MIRIFSILILLISVDSAWARSHGQGGEVAAEKAPVATQQPTSAIVPPKAQGRGAAGGGGGGGGGEEMARDVQETKEKFKESGDAARKNLEKSREDFDKSLKEMTTSFGKAVETINKPNEKDNSAEETAKLIQSFSAKASDSDAATSATDKLNNDIAKSYQDLLAIKRQAAAAVLQTIIPAGGEPEKKVIPKAGDTLSMLTGNKTQDGLALAQNAKSGNATAAIPTFDGAQNGTANPVSSEPRGHSSAASTLQAALGAVISTPRAVHKDIAAHGYRVPASVGR